MIATKKHTFSRDLKTHLLNIILTKCSLTLRRLSMLQTFYCIHDTIIVWQLQYNIIWRRHRLHYDKIHSRTIYHRTLLPHRCCSHLSTDWKCTHFVTSTWYGTIILTVSPLHLLCGPCSSCLLPKTWLTNWTPTTATTEWHFSASSTLPNWHLTHWHIINSASHKTSNRQLSAEETINH